MRDHGVRSPEPLKRILLVRTDRLGDVILTLPMLSVLRRCYPQAHIAMLLRRYTGAILEGNPKVDEIVWYDNAEGLVPFAEIRDRVRGENFDAAIVCYPRPRLAWLMYRSGIPLRVGTGYRYYSFLFNRRVFEHRKDARRHEVEYNVNLLSALGCAGDVSPAETTFDITIPPAAQSRVDAMLRAEGVNASERLIVLHPGSGGSAREWPVGYFGQLASRLSQEERTRIVVTGGISEEEKVRQVVDAAGGRAFGMGGKLSLMELAALFRQATIFVSNSTGPLHLAVAVGAPVVGLYPQITALSEKRWGPYTNRKRVLVPSRPVDCSDCTGSRGEQCACMESITVDAVHDQVRSLMSESFKSNRQVAAHE